MEMWIWMLNKLLKISWTKMKSNINVVNQVGEKGFF